jgi:hypothetical protein
MKKCYDELEKEHFLGRNLGFHVVHSTRWLCFWNTIINVAAHDYLASERSTIFKILTYPYTIAKCFFATERQKQCIAHAYENFTVDVMRVTFLYAFKSFRILT